MQPATNPLRSEANTCQSKVQINVDNDDNNRLCFLYHCSEGLQLKPQSVCVRGHIWDNLIIDNVEER